MDLSKIKKIYMIGIKGVGMAMLAKFFASSGIEVIGSDTAETFMTDEPLKRAGIKIIEQFNKENIPPDADLIIYSTAYNAERNEEVAEAFTRKTRVLTYAQALGEIFNQKYGIAVVGSHGKTTTTAWLGFVLDRAGLKPNVMVGATVPQFGGPSLVSASNYLIVEVDEYQNKLQYFSPKAVLLNNIDYDHPDFFPTEEDYRDVFVEFIKRIPPSGFLVANFDDPVIRSVAAVNCRGKVASYGIHEAANYVAYDLKNFAGRQYFKVKMGLEDGGGPDGNSLGDFSIALAGRHNVSNALAVIAAAIELEVPLTEIRTHLSDFTGTARRLDKLGEFNGAIIYDDYAHHPAEIKAALAGIRQLYPNHHQYRLGRCYPSDNKLIVVFHPHTFTRTKALLDDFAVSFDLADELIVLDIYGSAREVQGGIHAKDLVEKIEEHNQNRQDNYNQQVSHIPTLAEAETYLREHVRRGDVVLLMGAGDVFRVGENLLK